MIIRRKNRKPKLAPDAVPNKLLKITLLRVESQQEEEEVEDDISPNNLKDHIEGRPPESILPSASGRGRIVHPDINKFALSLLLISPEAYRFVRSEMEDDDLPSEDTVRYWFAAGQLPGQTRPAVQQERVKDEPSESETEQSDNKEDETLVKIEEMKANCLEVKLEAEEADPLDPLEIRPYRIWSSKKGTRKH